ncbi:MAG: pantoate kinase [Methanotrichaceae archaeon]|nr:pantoate kinase [Methanotrichaceae archaeon]
MRASVPSHITGFFSAKRHDDPMKSGSMGCGLTLDLKAITTIEPAEETEIFLNYERSDAPVSRFVVNKLSRSPVRVQTELEMPLGAGFGASGAGALGSAYSLNASFELGMTANQAAAVAHIAEVIYGTGLGDVIAQNIGGLVIRSKAGGPGIGKVDRIPVPPLWINYVVRGPISTKEVLSDPKIMKGINCEGKASLKELLKKPTLKDFMRLSRRFATRTELASNWASDAIEAVESSGGFASMILLGDAVFALGSSDSSQALKEFGAVGTTFISQRGANLD